MKTIHLSEDAYPKEWIEDDFPVFQSAHVSKLAPRKRHAFLRFLGKLLNVYIPPTPYPFKVVGKHCIWLDNQIYSKTNNPFSS